MTEPWASVDDVAKHLGVAKDSVYRWIEHRGLPAHKIGRLWKFKSSWERDYAVALDQMELTWTYEAHRLLLSDGRTYIPDFFIAEWNAYVEVKGWRGFGYVDKIDQARRDGHDVLLVSGSTSL